MILVGILVSIIMFSIIVIIHEYGHYKTARIFGIHIEEFGLGIPPRAKKLWKNKTGTLFSLNWIPLGGFVKISGESELFLEYYGKTNKVLSHKGILKKLSQGEDIFNRKREKIKSQERKLLHARLTELRPGENFYEKNVFARSIVLLAGVIMNFILAIIIFTGIFMIGVQPIGINSYVETSVPSKLIPSFEDALEQGIIVKNEGIILSPIEGSIAEKSGIQKGDILLRVNEIAVSEISFLQEIIQNSKNQEISFYINRNTQCNPSNISSQCPIIEYMNVIVTPNQNGLIGAYLGENLTLNNDFVYKYGFFESLKYGIYETYSQIHLTLSGLSILITNIFSPETPQDREEALESVAGPIGIVSVITQSLEGGIMLLLVLAGLISINLGVFNLLPIPALDGGRLLLLWIRSAIDKIFGKSSTSANIENLVHVMFFLVLIALSILIAYNDIIKIFSQ